MNLKSKNHLGFSRPRFDAEKLLNKLKERGLGPRL
jgi:hypothetical protein